jgi:tRNA A37 threonylcarbamoyladenosine dehydratase
MTATRLSRCPHRPPVIQPRNRAGAADSGIGAVHLADFDTVEEANLTRQLLYTEADIGRPKLDTAVARSARSAPSWTASTAARCC